MDHLVFHNHDMLSFACIVIKPVPLNPHHKLTIATRPRSLAVKTSVNLFTIFQLLEYYYCWQTKCVTVLVAAVLLQTVAEALREACLAGYAGKAINF